MNYGAIIGLLLLLVANALLGSGIAKLYQKFNWKVSRAGILRILSIFLGVILLYVVGLLNKDLIVMSVNDTSMSILQVMDFICISGIIFYAVKCIKQIIEIIGIYIPIEEGE